MRVLVTGAAGQVGAAVVAALDGHDVLAADHARLDIGERQQVEEVVDAFGPDAIVHCAAMTDVDACERDVELAYVVNALGARHLSIAARRLGAHVVHVSTDYVFDGRSARPYTEWDAPNPLSVYGRSKLGGEHEVASHAPSWAIARTAWVFGRRGRDVVQLALDAAAGADVGFVDDQTGSPTYAPDLACVLARLALERREGVYHVVNRGACTRYQQACDVLELRGLEPGLLKAVSTADLSRPASRPPYSALDDLALRHADLPRLRHYRDALAEYLAAS